jgi:hypothetical protein
MKFFTIDVSNHKVLHQQPLVMDIDSVSHPQVQEVTHSTLLPPKT